MAVGLPVFRSPKRHFEHYVIVQEVMLDRGMMIAVALHVLVALASIDRKRRGVPHVGEHAHAD
jgi:hypothetical protein